ncbi:unknown [Ruminococcus sp. CAG:382]|nr:unknown [Ruminococcus sp. CAG:382]
MFSGTTTGFAVIAAARTAGWGTPAFSAGSGEFSLCVGVCQTNTLVWGFTLLFIMV